MNLNAIFSNFGEEFANANKAAEAAVFLDNRSRYVQQSAATRDGKRADIPPRVMAPLTGNHFTPSPSAAEPLSPPVAGGLDYLEQSND